MPKVVNDKASGHKMTSAQGMSQISYLNKKNRKAQEEIMGFIIIVVIIIVIGMVFIFMLKPKAKQEQNVQVENLLSAVRHATSACEKEMQDVMIMCGNDESCGTEKACDYLRLELKSMVDLAVEKAGLGNVIGYTLDLKGTSGALLSIKEGNQTGTSMAAISPIRQDLSAELRFFYP